MEEVRIDSRCGLVCAQCDFREPMACDGCILSNGHPFWGACRLAACCQDRNLLHCGLCPDFPCELLKEFSSDAEHGDTPPGQRIEQCRVWAKEGSQQSS